MRSRTALLALPLALCLACSDPERGPGEGAPQPEPTPAPETAPQREGRAPAERAQQVPTGLVGPSAMERVVPERLGPFERAGAATPHVDLGVVPTTRITASYADGERRASLRIVDAARAPDLVAGFAAAQRVGPADSVGGDELVPTGIASRPALASWSPATRTSEAQVLVAERFVVALTITPAQVPEEAVDVLETFSFVPLEQLAP